MILKNSRKSLLKLCWAAFSVTCRYAERSIVTGNSYYAQCIALCDVMFVTEHVV